MKNRIKKILFTLMLAGSVALLAAGCDKLKKQPETETETPTESETETEPPTESETQTESETEPPTESETQTEPETQTEVRRDLSVEEELAEETEFDTLRTVYAADDVNVREQPGKGDDINIFESFDQGEKLIVTGETPNWYVVEMEDYDIKGYVYKDFVSDTEVAPKSAEERAAAGETSTGDNEAVDTSASVNSSVDAEYGVGAYAEPFEIAATAGANVRQTPAADGEIISVVSSGTVVKVVGYTDRWYKIEYDGVVGYVNQNLFAAE